MKIKENIRQDKEKLKEKPYIIILIIVMAMYISGLISQGSYYLLHAGDVISKKIDIKEFSLGISNMIEWCTSIRGAISLVLTIIIMYITWMYIIKPRKRVETGIKDSTRNLKYAETDTYGSAKEMTEEEIEESVEYKKIEETTGTILGHKDGKVISLPTEKEFEEKTKKYKWSKEIASNYRLNKHMLIFGVSGSMKTRAIVINMIIQMVLRGESGIITDPKADVYERTATWCKKNGYNTLMINFVNPENSDSWNPLYEIEKNSLYATVFADTVVRNGIRTKEEYWVLQTSNLLKAFLLLVDESEYYKNNLGQIYDLLTEYTMEEIDSMFSTLNRKSVARRAYNAFKSSSMQVKEQVKGELALILNAFQDDKIRNITTDTDIKFDDLPFKKTIVFVVVSDQHSSFNYLTSLFYSMLFVKTVERIDRARTPNQEGNSINTTIPINLVLDEFVNQGEIADFPKKLSTVRSRDINIAMIIQNLGQLQAKFPYDYIDIMSNCDTQILLGTNDEITASYVSKRSGIATVEVKTENSVYDRQIMVLDQDPKFREVKSEGKREVFLLDELWRMKNSEEIIILRGKNVILAQKFDYSKHPASKDFEVELVKEHIPKWRKELEKKEKEKQEKLAMIDKKREEEEKRKLQREKELKKLKEEEQEKNKLEKTKEKKEQREKELEALLGEAEKKKIKKQKTTEKIIKENNQKITIEETTGEVIKIENQNTSPAAVTISNTNIKEKENIEGIIEENEFLYMEKEENKVAEQKEESPLREKSTMMMFLEEQKRLAEKFKQNTEEEI